MKRFITLLLILFTVFITNAQSIASWNFFGQTSPTTSAPSTYDASLVTTGNELTRGANAAANSAANSFRTTGFKNDGIATTNTDYFQFTLTPSTSHKMSLASINGKMAGTTSFSNSPGVAQQFAYSLDGTTFTLIGSAVSQIGNGALAPVTLSSITDLQNVPAGTTVTLRFYASGQTTTGGWGFNSPSAATTDNGLDIAGTVSLLPVKLISFSAINNINNVNVNWKVAQQIDITNYDVERSVDGIHFSKIGTVQAQNLQANYNYTDNSFLAGNNYYRLKINELNGTYDYSPIFKVKMNGKNLNINSIYPSPAKNEIKLIINNTNTTLGQLIITDYSGKNVYNKTIDIANGITEKTIQINNLNAGIYFIKIIANNETTIEKFIKQ